MNTVRERRLSSDHERLKGLVAAQKKSLGIESAQGAPPENYVVVFDAPSIVELKENEPVLARQHRLKIEMPADYPAVPPRVTVLGHIWHPHVWARNNVVCLGQWNITEPLDSLVLRLYSMLVYDLERLNWKSVANEQAALWARDHQHLFPLGRLGESRWPALLRPVARWYQSA